MFTTFDDIYKVYKRLVRGIEPYSLPQSVQEQIELIEIGVRLFNRKREGNEVVFDIVTETVVSQNREKLTDNEILLLAYCMVLQTYNDMLLELTSMLSMSTKDSSIKDYKGQVAVRRQQVRDQEFLINNLLLTMSEDFDNNGV